LLCGQGSLTDSLYIESSRQHLLNWFPVKGTGNENA